MGLLRDTIEWKSIIAPTIIHEKRFVDVLKKLFSKQEQEVLVKVNKVDLLNLSTVIKTNEFDLYLDKISLDEPKWNKIFAKTTTPLYKNMVKTSGSKVFADLNMSVMFDLDAPDVRDFIKNKTITFSKFVNGETNAGLVRIIRPIIKRGGTIEEVRERIQLAVRKRFKGSLRGTAPRSRMIARTEMVSSSNGGTLLGFEKSKIVKFKGWLTSKDKKVRDTHRSAGRRYPRTKGIPLKMKFKVGTALLSAPGVAVGGINKAREIINCRCVLIGARKGK